ncbi:hypothetical protein HQ47_07795 [Porphyromonas macacae]|uniref:Sulfatase N-terminal domain-containing protein n=1 Tax=Porphyromonas macacae TaxID=28115 RepID=A0A0A2E3B1_9PORP|nr:LTA synthase family protein [Porphyromonas macacae]KGN73358.1 hypothetical protein HQ47_07795 [Porphyromonas macacae]
MKSSVIRLIERMVIILVLYTLMRAIFIVYNNDLLKLNDNTSIWNVFTGGFQFDVSAILYTNILFILLSILPFRFRENTVYQKICKWIFLVVNGLCIIINMMDVAYYRFTLKRTTTSVFSEFRNENPLNFVRMIWDYRTVSLMILILIVLLAVAYKQTKEVNERYRSKKPFLYYGLNLLWMGTVIILTIGGMRGGLAHSVRPITLSNASAYIKEPQQRAAVLNTSFSLIRTIGKKTLQPIHFFTQEEAEDIYPVVQQFSEETENRFGSYKGNNVVIIIWESFAREWVGNLNIDVPGYEGYTPFIDSLCNHSLVYTNAYANGVKSIDAIPSVMTSLPHIGLPFISSHYSGNKLNSIPQLLKPEGYSSAFFHGANNGSMGFLAFANQIGFDRYYGATEFGDNSQHDGYWGIWDRPFLEYMKTQLDTMKQPFAASVFTVSSHHPYQLPKGFENKYREGELPLMKCIGYTDDALRNFFNMAKQSSWYENTLFVIVADHSIPGVLPGYKASAGAYRIPIIFFHPKGELTGRDTTLAQQIDIMPTVLNLLGYDKPFVSFGQNLMNPDKPHIAVMNQDDNFQMIRNDSLILFHNNEVYGLYDLAADRQQKTNLIDSQKDKAESLEKMLKAFIQSYNNRLLNNELTLEK